VASKIINYSFWSARLCYVAIVDGNENKRVVKIKEIE
jgi:hypothetical protein